MKKIRVETEKSKTVKKEALPMFLYQPAGDPTPKGYYKITTKYKGGPTGLECFRLRGS
jgi:hypothetical protein